MCHATRSQPSLTAHRVRKDDERSRVVDPLDLEAATFVFPLRKDSLDVAGLELRWESAQLQDARDEGGEERQCCRHGCRQGAQGVGLQRQTKLSWAWFLSSPFALVVSKRVHSLLYSGYGKPCLSQASVVFPADGNVSSLRLSPG